MAVQVVSVTDVDFQKQVVLDRGLILAHFRAAWCSASRQLGPIVEDLAGKYKGRARVVAIEMGPETKRTFDAYNVTRVPVVMLFKDGEAKDVIGGVTDARNIAEMIEAQLKPVVDLSEHNWDAEVLRSKVPVLVNFWAAACRQSTLMDEVIKQLATKYQTRAKMARLEVRPDTTRLSALCGVKRLPTTMVFSKGKVQDQFFGAGTAGSGVAPTNALDEMLGQFVK